MKQVIHMQLTRLTLIQQSLLIIVLSSGTIQTTEYLAQNSAADIELIRAANLKNYSPISVIYSRKNSCNNNRVQSKNILFDIWTRINKIVRNDHQLDNKTNLVLTNNAKTNKHTNNREHY